MPRILYIWQAAYPWDIRVEKVCFALQRQNCAVALLARQPVGRLVLERGRGCAACRQTGYRGRTGIFELLVVTEEIKQQLLRAPNAGALRALGEGQGMVTLRQDGWHKVQAGITTVEEVLRVTDQ